MSCSRNEAEALYMINCSIQRKTNKEIKLYVPKDPESVDFNSFWKE